MNNAGIGTAAYFGDASSDHLRRITEVNYLAAAELCRQAIPRMLGRGGGHIVNVSSMADCAVFPGLVAYSASKAALSHFTAGLRADLRGLSIGTTLVELGPIPTDLLAEAEDYAPTADSFSRFYRIRLAVDVPRETVGDEVVDAVQKGRPCCAKCPGESPKCCSPAYLIELTSSQVVGFIATAEFLESPPRDGPMRRTLLSAPVRNYERQTEERWQPSTITPRKSPITPAIWTRCCGGSKGIRCFGRRSRWC